MCCVKFWEQIVSAVMHVCHLKLSLLCLPVSTFSSQNSVKIMSLHLDSLKHLQLRLVFNVGHSPAHVQQDYWIFVCLR